MTHLTDTRPVDLDQLVGEPRCHRFPRINGVPFSGAFAHCGLPRAEQAPHGAGHVTRDVWLQQTYCPSCGRLICPACKAAA